MPEHTFQYPKVQELPKAATEVIPPTPVLDSMVEADQGEFQRITDPSAMEQAVQSLSADAETVTIRSLHDHALRRRSSHSRTRQHAA